MKRILGVTHTESFIIIIIIIVNFVENVMGVKEGGGGGRLRRVRVKLLQLQSTLPFLLFAYKNLLLTRAIRIRYL